MEKVLFIQGSPHLQQPPKVKCTRSCFFIFTAYQRQQLGILLQTGSSTGRTLWSPGCNYQSTHSISSTILQATCNQKEPACSVDVGAWLITTRPVHELKMPSSLSRRQGKHTPTGCVALSRRKPLTMHECLSKTEGALGKCAAASRLCPTRGSLRLLLISTA